MLEMEGYISLHRKIREHKMWKDKPFPKLQAWVDILLSTNWKEKDFLVGNSTIKIERGQFLTSVDKLSNRWGWSRCKTRDFLNLLEADEMIVRKSTSKYTVITVVNYDLYQSEKKEIDSKSTSNRHQIDITNKDNKVNKKEYKEKHLEFVLLTKTEYKKLTDEYTKEKIDDYILRLNNYIFSSGKKYASHYLTILNWIRRDKEKNEPKIIIPFEGEVII